VFESGRGFRRHRRNREITVAAGMFCMGSFSSGRYQSRIVFLSRCGIYTFSSREVIGFSIPGCRIFSTHRFYAFPVVGGANVVIDPLASDPAASDPDAFSLPARK
jgi:hypothetical protein